VAVDSREIVLRFTINVRLASFWLLILLCGPTVIHGQTPPVDQAAALVLPQVRGGSPGTIRLLPSGPSESFLHRPHRHDYGVTRLRSSGLSRLLRLANQAEWHVAVRCDHSSDDPVEAAERELAALSVGAGTAFDKQEVLILSAVLSHYRKETPVLKGHCFRRL
jgi:hypothetical protein